MADLNQLIKEGIFDIELGVANPRTSGVTAGEGAIGYATDGSRWVKVGPTDTDWEQILISKNGEYVVNFQLGNVTGTVPDVNQFGVSNAVGGVPTIGDGETTGGRRVAMSSDLSHITHFGNVEDGVVTSKYLTGELVNADMVAGVDHLEIGRGITSIGEYAVADYPSSSIPVSVKSVLISDTVTEIKGSAFYNNNLTEVKLPNSVTSIGAGAFRGGSISKVEIPDSVANFQGFENNLITEITIPDSVTSLGGLSNNLLTEITIPDSVTSLSGLYDNLFTEITIPDSVTSLGAYALYNNPNLSRVNAYIPKSVADGSYNFLQGTVEPLELHVRSDDDTWDALVTDSPTSYKGNNDVTVIKDL